MKVSHLSSLIRYVYMCEVFTNILLIIDFNPRGESDERKSRLNELTWAELVYFVLSQLFLNVVCTGVAIDTSAELYSVQLIFCSFNRLSRSLDSPLDLIAKNILERFNVLFLNVNKIVRLQPKIWDETNNSSQKTHIFGWRRIFSFRCGMRATVKLIYSIDWSNQLNMLQLIESYAKTQIQSKINDLITYKKSFTLILCSILLNHFFLSFCFRSFCRWIWYASKIMCCIRWCWTHN